MNRNNPLRADPAKARDWQNRSARKYAQKRIRRSEPQNWSENAQPARKYRPRRNDSGWRADVLARCGTACRACGRVGYVECDHLWPRGQGGPSHVLNGLPLCGPFGCDAHGKKTRSEDVIHYEWLDDEQRAWLADVGWVAWDDDGLPHGRGMRHFGPRTVLDR